MLVTPATNHSLSQPSEKRINLVAYADGKKFASERIETVAGEILENTDITDFQLVEASDIGTIEGGVLVNGADDSEQYATINNVLQE